MEPRQINAAVVVCTRDRPARLFDTLRSIALSVPAEKLIIVVDQSQDLAPSNFLESTEGCQVVWLASNTVGLSKARNIGVAEAARRGFEFVAFTDDDCLADHRWLLGLIEPFQKDATVAMVFGSTRPAPFDPDLGTIPGYIVEQTCVYHGIAAKSHLAAMGACMAIRLRALQAIGGFDEALGAGSELRSAEENDLSARLLLAGFGVSETTQSEVVHLGFRETLEAYEMVLSYMLGSGAATAKMLRLGRLHVLWPLAVTAIRWFMGRSAILVNKLPPRRDRLRAFLRGAKIGFTMKIDRHTGCFRQSYNEPVANR